MDSALVLASLINGLASGVIYMLIATGFTLMFGIAKILNFAHGEIYVGGTLVFWALVSLIGINYFGAVVLTILIIGLLGLLTDRVLFRLVRGDAVRTCIVSIGLLLIIQNIGSLLFPKAKGIPSVVHGVLHLGAATLSAEKLVIIGISVVIMLALNLFTKMTSIGRSMRATGQDAEAASMVGVNIDRVITITYIISFSLAGMAAVLMAPLTAVNAFVGGRILMKALIVVVVGGIGSVSGAVLGALLLGLVESIGLTFFGSLIQPAVFGILMLVLIFRPRGLRGREEVEF